MSDLRSWLREGVQTSDGCSHPIAIDIDAADALMATAADEIDRLTRELAEARDKALEEAAGYVEGRGGKIPGTNAFASLLSRNNQPCMSGDARDRLHKHDRRNFDDASEALAAAIRAMKEKP